MSGHGTFVFEGANMSETYRTSELEIASYLRAIGRKLLTAKVDGRFVAFEFEAAAANDVSGYFAGAETVARDLFEAHRSLRALIQQVKEHSFQAHA